MTTQQTRSPHFTHDTTSPPTDHAAPTSSGSIPDHPSHAPSSKKATIPELDHVRAENRADSQNIQQRPATLAPDNDDDDDERLAALIITTTTTRPTDTHPDDVPYMMSGALDDDDPRCALPPAECRVARREAARPRDVEAGAEEAGEARSLRSGGGRDSSVDGGKDGSRTAAGGEVGNAEGVDGCEGWMAGWRLVEGSDSDGGDEEEDEGEGDEDEDWYEPDVQYNVATRYGWL